MRGQEPSIPPSIMNGLQSCGFGDVIMQGMPYAQGIMATLSGQVRNDGDIITQDIQQAMENTGMTIDELTRFLFTLEDNITGLVAANPSISQPMEDLLRGLYFTMFIEYLKTFAVTGKYCPPEAINQVFQRMGADPVTCINIRMLGKNMYAMSAKNPPGISQPQLSPWLFIYNDAGNARLFLSKEEMTQYDKKYGKGLKKMLSKAFSKENLPMTAIGIASIVGIAIAIGIFAKKKKNRMDDEEKDIISEIEDGGDDR